MTHPLAILRESTPDRHQKAVRGLADGSLTITITRQTEQEIRAIVKNGDGKEYRCILTDSHAVCSCGDAFYRGATCKHLLAVCISQLQQPEQDNRIHLMWDNGHILCGVATAKRFWQNWTLNALNWSDMVCPACVEAWTHPAVKVAA